MAATIQGTSPCCARALESAHRAVIDLASRYDMPTFRGADESYADGVVAGLWMAALAIRGTASETTEEANQ